MTNFNKICRRAVVEFLTMENIQQQQIHKRMAVVYNEDVLSYAMVKRWAADFYRGRRLC